MINWCTRLAVHTEAHGRYPTLICYTRGEQWPCAWPACLFRGPDKGGAPGVLAIVGEDYCVVGLGLPPIEGGVAAPQGETLKDYLQRAFAPVLPPYIRIYTYRI